MMRCFVFVCVSLWKSNIYLSAASVNQPHLKVGEIFITYQIQFTFLSFNVWISGVLKQMYIG